MNSIGRVRSTWGVLAALAVLTLAAGCGDSSPSTPPSTPAPPSASPEAPPTIPTGAPPARPERPIPAADPLTSTPPAGATPLPASQVDAENLPPGFPTLVWTYGPRTVGVYGRAGGCTESRAEVADQTDAQVRIRVVQYSTGRGPCTRELRYPPLEVTLAADLGARRVVLVGVPA